MVTEVQGRRACPSPTRCLTAAQAVVVYLSQQYSDRDGHRRRLIPGMFGIFGHGNVVGLGEALEEYDTDLRYYQGKNEQAMVHAAIGHAKATLRTSTLACAGSVGPGALNMVTGAATATANRLPVLLLPADVFIRRQQDPVLQQIENPLFRDVTANDAFRAVSRYFDRITRPEQLLDSLPAALRVLTDPADTGAVTISLPQDVQGEAYDFPSDFFRPRAWQIPRRTAAEEEIEAAVAAITRADRPLIIAGGGVRYSSAEQVVSRLAAACGIPVSETHAGKGCGPHNDLGVGVLGLNGTVVANRLASRADCVIAIGTRLQDFTTGSRALFQNPAARFVSINVAATDAFKVGSVPVVGDALRTVERLAQLLTDRGYATSQEYRAEIRREADHWTDFLRADLTPRTGERMGQAEVLHALNQMTGHGDVVVTAAGTPPADVSKLWDTSNGSECHVEFGFSCMGHEIPAGIGYRLARAETTRDIYVIIGDGTYLMNNTELVTAVQEGLNITVVLIENGGFQAIRGLQMTKTGVAFGNEFRRRDDSGRLDGEFLAIDYTANAASLGCQVFRAETIAEFETAAKASRDVSGPKVIVVSVEPYRMMSATECFWDVGVAQVTELERVRQRTDEHLSAQRAQRYFPHPEIR
ncbi:3D-(3,5/4)-trihydroxycyclohexane-1,2-dione acylhydrolase (decyclizing) [Candidatus Protofrankia californiensis]|uniref:3D-(3,5/4)-trihydroxycyclohexane-1,2-dione acylhydrolase (decyclizing) n=1 Tax=Candidatus Protofrankia californiensis TaxID=1839754 RepID=UPI00104177EF|nr:3D-(3,5/4)-trihydroxycyclohexane-1,2-dione acylhydrolase (decyclizing) [Candidatus Protofrankia californiensis]